MSLWRQLTHGIRVLTRSRAADRDLADEIAHYLHEAEVDHLARGLSRDAAIRAARMEIGNATVVREHVRESAWEHVVATTAADVRLAVRRLRRSPGFAAVTVLTLGVGLGASTAIFGVVKPVLLEPLPYPGAGRIVSVADRSSDGRGIDVTFGTFLELVDRGRTLDAAAVVRSWLPTIVGAAQPERLEGERVSAGYFKVLGVSPLVGRAFDTDEDRVNGPNVVVLGDGLWRRRFGADSAVVGRDIVLDDQPYRVVGVMPPGFEDVRAPRTEVWAPLQYDASLPSFDGREWGHHLSMIARVRRGATVDSARRDLETIAERPLPEYPRPVWASMPRGPFVIALQDEITRSVKPALLAMFGAVVLVLAIACVNVTNLLLARGVQRRDELAMRIALGAPRTRIVRQLLTETVLLAVLSGACGLAVAAAGIQTLVALSPSNVPRLASVRVDASILVFALAASAVVGLVVGIAAGLEVWRRPELHASGARHTGSHQRARRTLVVAEVALAFVLLVCTGLLLRSLQRLLSMPAGFDSSGVLTMQVQTTGRRYPDLAATDRFFAQALDRVRRVPGVVAAGFVSQLPLAGRDMYGVAAESAVPAVADEASGAYRYGVLPGYFEALRIPLLRGRLFDAHDTAAVPAVAVISESLARAKFAGADALGRRVRVGGADGPWRTIVGVVGDVRQESLTLADADAVYVPESQWSFPDRAMWLVVRTHGDPARVAPAVEAAVWAIDTDLPIVRVATMDRLVRESTAERRFALMVFEAFAGVALLLAAIGIYAVLAGGVTERTREIGVRAALGASRDEIVGVVIRQGLSMAAIGIVFGAAAALLATRGLATLLFGISRVDPVTYVVMSALLMFVAALACWMPAARAARVDPAIALRAE